MVKHLSAQNLLLNLVICASYYQPRFVVACSQKTSVKHETQVGLVNLQEKNIPVSTCCQQPRVNKCIKNDQMEHRHCRRIAVAILGCADEHSVALLLVNEKEEAHGTPERCSPAK